MIMGTSKAGVCDAGTRLGFQLIVNGDLEPEVCRAGQQTGDWQNFYVAVLR